MRNQIVSTHPGSELSKEARRTLLEYGLWLRIGFIGASAVAVALLQLFSGDVSPLPALALAAGGGVLAAGSWWRCRTLLNLADWAPAVAAGALLPAGARTATST
jgi:hypothetical protein